MQVSVNRKIYARVRRSDGTDNGCLSLPPGQYQANKTNDGCLEIFQENGESLYLLPFVWWERMKIGEIVIS
jgi:hypothetical protein